MPWNVVQFVTAPCGVLYIAISDKTVWAMGLLVQN